jgi:hypothetical protein
VPDVGVTGRGALIAPEQNAKDKHGVVTDHALKPGDGVVFDEGHPEQDEQGGRVASVLPRGMGLRRAQSSRVPLMSG